MDHFTDDRVRAATTLVTVATKYYTHFVTGTAQARSADERERMERGSRAASAAGSQPEARASCARCWHRVSSWTRTRSRFSTGPGCTDYPLADFLPFIESPHLRTPGRQNPGVFFHWAKVGCADFAGISAQRTRLAAGKKRGFCRRGIVEAALGQRKCLRSALPVLMLARAGGSLRALARG